MHLDLKAHDYSLLIDSINWELDLLKELGYDSSPRFKRLVEIQARIQAFVDDVPREQKRPGSFIPRLQLSKQKPPSREFPYSFNFLENGVTIWLNKKQYWDLRKAFWGKAKKGDPVALKHLKGFGPLPKN